MWRGVGRVGRTGRWCPLIPDPHRIGQSQRIGPYSFTEQDARRTVELLPGLWAQLESDRDPATIAHLRPRLTGDTAVDLALVWEALRDAGPALRAAGQLPNRSDGLVAGLARGGGGVPKQAVEHVEVAWNGVVGDRQATRIHHGRPWQGLCLWSLEVISDLRRAGHPIAAGSAGENVTISGIDWALVRAGVRLQLGEVICDVSSHALPCRANAQWFFDGDVNHMHHDRGPVSRMYATVVRPGHINVGDPAILEP